MFTPPKVSPPKVTPPKKNMRYTAVELEQIRIRREKLQQDTQVLHQLQQDNEILQTQIAAIKKKIKENHRKKFPQDSQVLHQLQQDNEILQTQIAAIKKKIKEKNNKILSEEKAIEDSILVKIEFSMTRLPAIELLPQDEEIVSLLFTLVQLIKNKFAISQLTGHFNLLDKENLTIHFPTGILVSCKEKYEFDSHFFDNFIDINKPLPKFEKNKLEGQPAIDYFKALGCTVEKKEVACSDEDMVVMLPIFKCKEAIRGLPLMGSPTPEEREFREQATIEMKC